MFRDQCGRTNFAQAESQVNTSPNPYPWALNSARHLCPYVTLSKSSVIEVNESALLLIHFPSALLRGGAKLLSLTFFTWEQSLTVSQWCCEVSGLSR